jgi:RNA 2',3'-cyclic 3'-phosphodiesterase
MTVSRQPPLRVFIALWPEPDVRAELARRAMEIAKECAGRPARADALHLTLAFIGATRRERVASLRKLMEDIRLPEFKLFFDDSGWWRHNGIVWAGTRAVPETLLTLQQELARGAERLGFSLDVRPYVPHLTLARDARRSPPAVPMAPLEWTVRSFVLVASELTSAGARYHILHEHALEAIQPAVSTH